MSSLKWALLGRFTPQKLANTADQRASCQHTTAPWPSYAQRKAGIFPWGLIHQRKTPGYGPRMHWDRLCSLRGGGDSNQEVHSGRTAVNAHQKLNQVVQRATVYITAILDTRKLRHREAESLVHSHTVRSCRVRIRTRATGSGILPFSHLHLTAS